VPCPQSLDRRGKRADAAEPLLQLGPVGQADRRHVRRRLDVAMEVVERDDLNVDRRWAGGPCG
jgi:hypothetical protein